jgi:hypothetical protein
MNCPKCGYQRQSRDNAFVPPCECPACGLVYSKHDPTKEPIGVVQPTQSPNLRPSPVDALSLRKARERVEKRLREQLGTRIKDDRHTQTLELAKRLTAEQVRKRQDEWKQAHTEGQVIPSAADEAVPAEVQEEFPELNDTDETATPDAVSLDRQTADENQAADQDADEITTSTEAAMQETDDSPAPVVEDPPESTDDTESVSEEASAMDEAPSPADDTVTDSTVDMEVDGEEYPEDDEEAALGSETVTDSMDEPVAAAEKETLPVMEPPPADPETEGPVAQDVLPVDQVAAAISARASTAGSSGRFARLLSVVAWMILAAGIIGAVLSWTTIGGVESGMSLPAGEGLRGLPLGLMLGFAYLATGVLGFAFFWVSSLISTQLRDIYHLLISGGHNENSLQDETAYP